MTTTNTTSDKQSTGISEGRQFSDDAYQDPDVLKTLYHDEGLTSYEIGDKLGVSKDTVLRWMEKHGIDRRNRGNPRVERASYGITDWGYPRWQTTCNGEWQGVYVHELAAIAGGADPYEVFSDQTTVHHRAGSSDGAKRYNVPENLEVVDESTHQQLHDAGNWCHDPELGHKVLTRGDN